MITIKKHSEKLYSTNDVNKAREIALGLSKIYKNTWSVIGDYSETEPVYYIEQGCSTIRNFEQLIAKYDSGKEV